MGKALKRSLRILRWTILTAFVLLAIAFLGLLVIQKYFSSFLQDYVRTEFGWSLKIGSAEIQFQPLSIRLESIELSAQNNKPFFQAKAASANLPYSSLWSEEFLIHEIVLDSPKLNFDLLPVREAVKQTTGDHAKTFRIENAIVHEGEVGFGDNEFKSINLKSQIDSKGLRIQEFETKFREIRLTAEGSCKDWNTLDISYKAQGDAAEIVSFVPSIFKWKGPFDAEGRIRGEVKKAEVVGRVKSSRMILEHGPPFGFDAEYKYKISDEIQPLSIKANIESFPMDVLRTHWKQMPEVSSVGKSTVQYAGGKDFWNGKGSLDLILVSGNSKGLPLSGNIFATLENGSIQIHPADLRLHATQLKANGMLFPNELSMNADFQTSRLKDIAFLYPEFDSIQGEYRVKAIVSGAYADMNVDAVVSGSSGNSTIEAKGKIQTGSKTITAQFQGNADTQLLKAVLPDFQKGDVVYEGTVAGTWKNPQVTASLSATELEFRKLKLQQLSTQITTESNNLLFHTVAPDLQLMADGSYSLKARTFKLQGKMDGSDAEVVTAFFENAPAVRGKIYADFEAAGNINRWKNSTALVHLRMPELQWKDVVFQVPETEIHLEEQVAVVSTRILSPNGQLELSGNAALRPHFPLDLQVHGKLSGALLERISKDWKGEGNLDFNATIQGDATQPKFAGKAVTENFLANYLPKKSRILLNKAEAVLSEQKLNLSGIGTLNDSPISWSGNLPLTDADGEVHFEITNFPVSALTQSDKLSGNLGITGDFQGKGFPLRSQLNKWSGNLSITPADLKLGTNDLTFEQALLVRIQGRKLEVSNTRIRSGDVLNFEGSGSVNLDTGQIESKARLEARIDLLSSLKADIQSKGPLILDARVGGTIKDPEYNGTIQLNNASLRIPNFPLVFENLDVLASINDKGLRVDKLQARSGGGLITGGGELVRKSKGSEVWLQGKNVAANYPDGLRSQLDFDMKLTSLESGILLSGDVHVLRSLYEQELTPWNPIVRKLLATTKKLSAEKAFENKLKLAVNVRTVQDFRFKNNSAILRAGGNLKIEGSLYRPALSGSLNVREGSRIFLSGNQYDVEKASVEFFAGESVEPNFDITLSSLLRDFQTDTYYEVLIPFGGTPSNIEFKNVRSTPSLSQDQIFSLLTEGSVESQQIGSSGVFQQQLLSFFAGQTLGVPTAKIAKSIGLSRIKVQQEGLHSVNDPKTRLMLGKDIGAGFSLIYSFVLNEPDEQTWIATYRYGRNIIGRFIDQDDDTFTVSVSHKIPFGKGVKPGSLSFDSRKKDRGSRVTSLEVKNNSPLTEKQIDGTLKTDVGDFYDYWDFQDRVDDLKKELQKLEYLYPSIDVREKETGNDSVALEVEIRPGNLSEMTFKGFQPSEKLVNTYKKMWRTGISAVVVQQMIREDLLHELQLEGHHQAVVSVDVRQSTTHTIYSFDVIPGTQYQTVELKFEGAQNYDPATLQRDASELYRSTGDLFREAIHNPSSFSEKVKMLYAQRGYLQSVVEPGKVEFSADGKITRVIRVKEGVISQIDTVHISGAQAFPDSLQTRLQLREGELFIPDELFEDEQQIREFYESSGHQTVSVHYNIDFKENTSNLLLQWVLNAGPLVRIASIRIEGNQSTRNDLILNQIKMKEGDVLTQENRSVAKKRLLDLGVFQQADIEAEETDVPGLYDVVVHVTENKRYEFQYGGRYNTDDKFGAELRLTDFNFLGRAHNLSLYGRSTLELPLFRVDYILPVIGNFWDRTRISIFRDQTDEDVRATVAGDLIKIPFEQKQLTFQFQQDYRLWTNYRLIWSFEYGNQEADFEDLAGSPRQFTGTEALFRSAFVADRRDDPLNASRGYFYSINGEYAPIMFGSDISYAKNFSQIFYYKKIGKIINAVGMRAGFLKIRSNILTVSEKFRTGGSTTLRGFVHNTVVPGDDPISIFFGGDSVFIFNEEIRFPLYKFLTGAVFYDAGNVYLRASDFDPTDLRHSAGFGVRAGAGGFVLRFDFGFNLNPEEDEDQTVFHFGIGQAF